MTKSASGSVSVSETVAESEPAFPARAAGGALRCDPDDCFGIAKHSRFTCVTGFRGSRQRGYKQCAQDEGWSVRANMLENPQEG